MRLSFEMIIFYTKLQVFFVNTWNKLYHTYKYCKVCLKHHALLNKQIIWQSLLPSLIPSQKLFLTKKDNVNNTGNVHIMKH